MGLSTWVYFSQFWPTDGILLLLFLHTLLFKSLELLCLKKKKKKKMDENDEMMKIMLIINLIKTVIF